MRALALRTSSLKNIKCIENTSEIHLIFYRNLIHVMFELFRKHGMTHLFVKNRKKREFLCYHSSTVWRFFREMCHIICIEVIILSTVFRFIQNNENSLQTIVGNMKVGQKKLTYRCRTRACKPRILACNRTVRSLDCRNCVRLTQPRTYRWTVIAAFVRRICLTFRRAKNPRTHLWRVMDAVFMFWYLFL